MNFEQQLIILLSSRSCMIYITTTEEERLENFLQQLSKKIFQNSIYSWDFINGYINNPNTTNKASKNPLQALDIIEELNSETSKIFLLKDYHFFLNDQSIIRKIKNIIKYLRENNCYIIMCAPINKIPKILNEYINIIEFPLPNQKEIEIELQRLLKIIYINDKEYLSKLKLAYKGFSIDKIRQSVSKLALNTASIDNNIQYIELEKQQIIKQTDILDFYSSTNNLNDIGGLTQLKTWLQKRTNSFSKKAKYYGLPNPKGILLVGIQGTGKSLSAKAISKEWNLPLLKLDIGKIFAGLIGESEIRIRQAIEISEQCAPCIVWIDEIDKAFTKMTYSNDSGTTNRVLASLLTWLAEKESEVFIVATANSLLTLPTEIIRKGRFDEIFFVDLPNIEERLNIFTIHLKKMRPLTWSSYDLKYLSNITDKFSGAEIEQVIIEAMYNGFYENREFTTNDIIYAIEALIPLAFTDQENIQQLQEWAYSGKVRMA